VYPDVSFKDTAGATRPGGHAWQPGKTNLGGAEALREEVSIKSHRNAANNGLWIQGKTLLGMSESLAFEWM